MGGLTDMTSVFEAKPTFNGDISSWNTASVSDTSPMFARTLSASELCYYGHKDLHRLCPLPASGPP